MFLCAESYLTRTENDSVTGFMAGGLSRSKVGTIGLQGQSQKDLRILCRPLRPIIPYAVLVRVQHSEALDTM
jgi:hypothetical protein